MDSRLPSDRSIALERAGKWSELGPAEVRVSLSDTFAEATRSSVPLMPAISDLASSRSRIISITADRLSSISLRRAGVRSGLLRNI